MLTPPLRYLTTWWGLNFILAPLNFGFKLWLLHFVMDVHRCLNELWLCILADLNTNTNQDKELGLWGSLRWCCGCVSMFHQVKRWNYNKNLGVMTYVIAIFVSNHQFISVGRLKIWWWLSYFQPSYNEIRKCSPPVRSLPHCWTPDDFYICQRHWVGRTYN